MKLYTNFSGNTLRQTNKIEHKKQNREILLSNLVCKMAEGKHAYVIPL